MLIRNILLWITLVFLLVSCNEKSATEPDDVLSMVSVELQQGFAGHLVILEFNDEEYYRAELSESAPFAGPLASFSTYLPRGKNMLRAFWQSDGYQVGPYKEDSLIIEIGDAKKYFLGISAYEDSLYHVIQDIGFTYL